MFAVAGITVAAASQGSFLRERLSLRLWFPLLSASRSSQPPPLRAGHFCGDFRATSIRSPDADTGPATGPPVPGWLVGRVVLGSRSAAASRSAEAHGQDEAAAPCVMCQYRCTKCCRGRHDRRKQERA